VNPARRAATVAALTITTLASAAACSPTTYDTSITTTVPGGSTLPPETLPTGTAAELLPRLVAEAGGLSALIVDGGDDQGAARRIAELWDAVKQEVARSRPELLGDFEANVARCQRAADRNRAADADKAYLALEALVRAFLA
jgi:hypothetical protein